jgi:flavodoxin
MKNCLVIYYSWLGNTKVVAEEILKLTGGDIVRIEETKERKTGAGFATAAMSAVFGMQSKLKSIDFEFEKYDHIFLGSQVWAGRSTPAINSFVKKANFRNKDVYLFITKADEKVPEKVIESLTKRIKKGGGKVVDSFSMTTKIDQVILPSAVEDQVEAWIEKLNNMLRRERVDIL